MIHLFFNLTNLFTSHFVLDTILGGIAVNKR